MEVSLNFYDTAWCHSLECGILIIFIYFFNKWWDKLCHFSWVIGQCLNV